MTQTSHHTLAAFVGIDWADATQDGGLQAAGSGQRAYFQLEPTPEAIDAGVTALRTRFHGQPGALCLERTKGPLVFALRKDAFRVRFPINPLTLARYRQAFTPSRAKDDPSAAELPLALRLTPRDQRQPLNPQRPTMRALEPLVAHRRRVVGENVRMTSRLTRTLKNDFPQVLQWCEDKDPHMFCAFLSRWPPRKAAQLARRTTLETCFRDHRVRAEHVIAQGRHAITVATPLTTAEGVIAPHALLVQALVAQLRVTLQAIADVDTAIAQHAQRHPDCPLSQALPGAGPGFAPRLLVAFGEQRARDASAAARHKRVLPRPPNAAGRSPGYTGASSVPRSSANRWWSGRQNRSGTPAGPSSPTSSHARRAKPITRPYGPWRANGSASSIGVGRTEPRMMSLAISTRSTNAARHSCTTVQNDPERQ
jgi:hypothetical protein